MSVTACGLWASTWQPPGLGVSTGLRMLIFSESNDPATLLPQLPKLGVGGLLHQELWTERRLFTLHPVPDGTHGFQASTSSLDLPGFTLQVSGVSTTHPWLRPETGCPPGFLPPLPHPHTESRASTDGSTSHMCLNSPSPALGTSWAWFRHSRPLPCPLVSPSVPQLCSLSYCLSDVPSKFGG